MNEHNSVLRRLGAWFGRVSDDVLTNPAREVQRPEVVPPLSRNRVLRYVIIGGHHGPNRQIQFEDDLRPCPTCCRNIQRCLVEYPGQERLPEFNLRVRETVLKCGCMSERPQVDQVERRAENGDAYFRPMPPKPRIKILPAASQVHLASVSAPQTPPAISVLPRAPKVTVLSSATESLEVEETSDFAHNVPEVFYELPSGSRVCVLLPVEFCEALDEHCGESRSHGREIGGVLVGYSHETDRENGGIKDYKIVVTDIIPISSSDASGAHVKLDEEAWAQVEQDFDEKFAPQCKVRLGWYHTHPTQGIFFSGRDLDAHTVFTQPHQFALVVDPRRMEAGLFYWDDYAERQLSGPVRFMLRRQRDGKAASAAHVGRHEQEENTEAPRPVSWLRFTTFVIAAVLVAAYVVRHSSVMRIAPDQACLLALTIFVGFRLWNARIFHPKKLEVVDEDLPHANRGISAGGGRRYQLTEMNSTTAYVRNEDSSSDESVWVIFLVIVLCVLLLFVLWLMIR